MKKGNRKQGEKTMAKITTEEQALAKVRKNGDALKRRQAPFVETTLLRALKKSADIKRCQRSWREKNHD